MLEKFGLPAKPSLKGNTWVVDASHCQGCSSQFTFINRKHHCRRCGGLFCNSCTNQRRILRGQGDSPVRICEPCKKLEEAARLELRSGNKSRAGKGATKLPSNPEEDLLNQILNNETNDSTSDATSSSSYNIVGPTQNTTTTPEQLREQASEEKNKYKILKSQGKSVEAMKAFKKSKEFEREASALELNLRKNRIKALKEDSGTSLRKNNVLIGEKDELANELKELGWSDIEVKDGVKKVGPVSIESELISLLGENTEKKKIGNNNNNPDKKRVIAHKKKALELKREGNLIEAKEELKKAKILEKKIEELELLGEDDEESDDELADLIRSVENEKTDKFSINREIDFNFDFNFNEINEENDVEIDDYDEDDPEIVAALSSFGWVEESQSQSKKESQSLSKKVGPTKSRAEIQRELLALKKKARVLRSEGKVDEADAELAKCKVLENMLEEINDVSKIKQPSIENEDVTEQDMNDPSYELMLNSLGWKDDNEKTKDLTAKSSKRSRVVVQRELLGIKKKALGLKREGKVNEAEAELAKGKILEKELEEIDNNNNNNNNNKGDVSLQPSISNKQPSIVVNNEEEDVIVTDQEMNDPDYLAVLNGFGWKDDNEKVKDQSAKKSKSEIQRELLGLKRKSFSLRKEGKFDEAEEVLKRAKVLENQLEEFETEKKVLIEPELSEIVKEVNLPSYPSESKSDLSVLKSDILARKRKAVMLKKEGKIAEAKEELIQAKLLEKQLETTPNSSGSHISSVVETSISAKNPNSSGSHVSSVVEKKEETSISAKKPLNDESSGSHITSAKKPLSSRERFKMQQQSLNHKRTSLKLRKEGRIEEAEAETLLAKAIEAQLEESNDNNTRLSENNDVSVEDFLDPQLMSALKGLGIPDIGVLSVPEGKKSVEKIDERKQLEEEIRAEKVKAVNLKKSGKTKEALDALRRAKLIEKKLNLLLSE